MHYCLAPRAVPPAVDNISFAQLGRLASAGIMPHKQDYSTIIVTELHPTFAAQVEGVDFSRPISDEVFAEIQQAITQVRVSDISLGRYST